jgi:hypothetical protein
MRDFSCVQRCGDTHACPREPLVLMLCHPVNTVVVFCRPGMKKQRACVPCPTGYVTNGVTGAKAPTACGTPFAPPWEPQHS